MKTIVPKHIKNFLPYLSSRKIGLSGKIFLNANESPYYKIFTQTYHTLNRYPEFQDSKLLQKYSKYSRVSEEQILITRGSDEAIDLLIRTFCNSRKDLVMYFPPTYDMYKICAQILNVKTIRIPSIKNFQLNLTEIFKNLQSVKLIYICNPNNPTGTLINSLDLIYILKNISIFCLVVIDEAYIEFSIENSSVKLLSKYSNLVILRTLSKAFGLAGIRCGFILSSVNVIKFLKKVLAPYPIPSPVSSIAKIALKKENYKKIQKNILKILKNRDFLVSKILKLSFIQKIYHSQTNFVLIKFTESQKVFKYLLENGIVVRDQSHKNFLNNCLRISIGTFEECSELITILYKMLKME
ncbi:histidinol-phosphate transaminase [Buchnera aphidicola]|uniref:histidinol-phosphate transaminase n=1 Tax=Buchnera aphidicola TaxID=9 RepID=UPI0031B73DF2